MMNVNVNGIIINWTINFWLEKMYTYDSLWTIISTQLWWLWSTSTGYRATVYRINTWAIQWTSSNKHMMHGYIKHTSWPSELHLCFSMPKFGCWSIPGLSTSRINLMLRMVLEFEGESLVIFNLSSTTAHINGTILHHKRRH